MRFVITAHVTLIAMMTRIVHHLACVTTVGFVRLNPTHVKISFVLWVRFVTEAHVSQNAVQTAIARLQVYVGRMPARMTLAMA